MCGHLENVEKFNTEIMQPLKKLPILLCLSSTSQALCGYRALLKHVIEHFSSTLSSISQALIKQYSSISEALLNL
jgi:hypothetical protein